MPRSFPDLDSLENAARVHKFRQRHEDEDESNYRDALANHVRDVVGDVVESMEIRTGKGWNAFNEVDNALLLLDSLRR
jgi:hypothetical protein